MVYHDNHSFTNLSKNPMFHDRSKHIKVTCHFIQDRIQKREVNIQFLPTYQQVDSILTKPLEKENFEAFRDKLGLVQISFLSKREC